MIDRSRRHVLLQHRTHAVAWAVSLAFLMLLPIAALICITIGAIAAAVIYIAILVLYLVVVALVIGFAIAARSEGLGGIVFAIVIGLVAINAWFKYVDKVFSPPMLQRAAVVAQGGVNLGHSVLQDFVRFKWYLWPWIFAAAALAAAAMVWATIALLRCIPILKRKLFRIAYSCPACHYRGLPAVRCKCGCVIRDLVPSSHGVFHACCGSCHASMPTIDRLGRLELALHCARCDQPLNTPHFGRRAEYHIAVVGSIRDEAVAMVNDAMTVLRAPLEAAIRPSSIERETVFVDDERSPDDPSTDSTHSIPTSQFPAAIHLMSLRNQRIKRVYLYTLGAVDYIDESRRATQRFHVFVDAVVFVLKLGDHQALNKNSSASDRTESVLSSLLLHMEQTSGIKASNRLRIPLAIVVDEGCCERDSAGEKDHFMLNDPFIGNVRRRLIEIGLENFVRICEARFTMVKYFRLSNLNKSTEQHGQEQCDSSHSSAPFLWIASMAGIVR